MIFCSVSQLLSSMRANMSADGEHARNERKSLKIRLIKYLWNVWFFSLSCLWLLKLRQKFKSVQPNWQDWETAHVRKIQKEFLLFFFYDLPSSMQFVSSLSCGFDTHVDRKADQRDSRSESDQEWTEKS